MTDGPVTRPLTVAPRLARLVLVALSMGGVAFTLLILAVGWQAGYFGGPNDYTVTFDHVGDVLRAGGNPYVGLAAVHTLYYAPPWAVAFALVAWLPVPVASALLLAAELAALRYIAGSWLAVGLVGWCPLLAYELPLGNINLIVGACIFAAVRGQGWAGIVGGLAKLSPVLAIRHPRSAAIALGVALLVTLPWLWLWPEWIRVLGSALLAGGTGGPQVPVPLAVRVVLAIGLLALRRPWATALACVIAIPGFYYQTLLLLVVPLVVWIREDEKRPRPKPLALDRGEDAGRTWAARQGPPRASAASVPARRAAEPRTLDGR